MKKDPTKRFTTDQALKHPWFVSDGQTAAGHERSYTFLHAHWPMTLVFAGLPRMQLKTLTFISLCVSKWREHLPNSNGRSATLLLVIGKLTDLVLGYLWIWLKWMFENPWRHSVCLFWQRAFHAATVVNHLRKVHSSQSEPSLSSSSSPDVLVQSSSQRDRKTLGSSEDEAEELDPNGNPLPDGGHVSCCIPGSSENVCQLLRVHPNKPGLLVTADGWALSAFLLLWITRGVKQENRQKLHCYISGVYYIS